MLGTRTVSLSIIFISLLGIFYSIGLLARVYANNWQVFGPYLLNGNLFWLLIFASALNILLATKITQIKTSLNFLYGIIIAASAAGLLLVFTPLSVFSIFTANTTDLMINIGRFFLISGFALFLLEIPSMLKMIGLNRELGQSDFKFGSKLFFPLQLATIFISFYMTFAVIAFIVQNPTSDTLANSVLAVTILFTGLIPLVATVFKTWLK